MVQQTNKLQQCSYSHFDLFMFNIPTHFTFVFIFYSCTISIYLYTYDVLFSTDFMITDALYCFDVLSTLQQ